MIRDYFTREALAVIDGDDLAGGAPFHWYPVNAMENVTIPWDTVTDEGWITYTNEYPF